MAKELCILDVRSNTITLATGECSNKGLINITGRVKEEYEGYFDGEWLNTSSLEEAVGKAYHKLQPKFKHSEIYVSVPASFCNFYGNVVTSKLSEESVITSKTLSDIALKGGIVTGDTERTIHRNALGYRIDGTDVVCDPVGMSGSVLKAFLSQITCNKSFCSAIENILHAVESERAEYICSMYAQSMTLLDQSYRTSGELLLDLGYLECSVAGVRGEGLYGLESATTGAAVIASDLTECLDVDIYSALTLFGQIDLDADYDSEFVYNLPKDGEVLQYRAADINGVVRQSIKSIADRLSGIVDEISDDEDCKRVFATGDALFNIRGAIRYLAKCMGKTITPLAPNVPEYDRMRYSSVIALMRQAQIRKSEAGYLSRLINKFRRV